MSGNGRGLVPNVRQSLYSEIISTLAVEPQAAVGKDEDELPVATGLPRPGTTSPTSSLLRNSLTTGGGKPS